MNGQAGAKMGSDTLGALLQATAGGDRRAFARLYDQTAPQLFGLALGILKRRDWAEEALQDAYTRIWRSAHRYDAAKGTGISWVVTIARNTALSTLMRRPRDEFAGNADDMAQMPSGDSDPMQRSMQLSDARQISGCLDELDGDQKSSILLVYYEGLTQKEVADRLNKPIGTVKSWIRRGLIRLKGCLDRASA